MTAIGLVEAGERTILWTVVVCWSVVVVGCVVGIVVARTSEIMGHVVNSGVMELRILGICEELSH